MLYPRKHHTGQRYAPIRQANNVAIVDTRNRLPTPAFYLQALAEIVTSLSQQAHIHTLLRITSLVALSSLEQLCLSIDPTHDLPNPPSAHPLCILEPQPSSLVNKSLSNVSTGMLSLTGFHHWSLEYAILSQKVERGYVVGGAGNSITANYVFQALDDRDWPWRVGREGRTISMTILESPGSTSTKSASAAALQLDTPLERVKFVRPGKLPVPLPLEYFNDYLNHPFPNFQIPNDNRIHHQLYSESDVVEYRSLLLYEMLSSLYDAHRVVSGTKLRFHQDSSSGGKLLRPDIGIEVYYDTCGEPEELPAWNVPQSCAVTDGDFTRLKNHLLSSARKKLFTSIAEIKLDRVLAIYLRAMLELAEFDNRWEGLPDPPASLQPILARGSAHDDMEYTLPPSPRTLSQQSSDADREKAAAIWSQVSCCVLICISHELIVKPIAPLLPYRKGHPLRHPSIDQHVLPHDDRPEEQALHVGRRSILDKGTS